MAARAESPVSPEGIGIDELARRASTTVRTVRMYQERGLLPPPVRRGRRAAYGPEHLTRLRLVQRLADRGYSLAAIKDLTGAWDARHGLAHVLGLEEALSEPTQHVPPQRYSADQLAEMFPGDADGSALARAARIGLLVADGDDLVAPNPPLLEAGAQLVAAGVPLDAALDVAESILTATDRLAGGFVGLFVEHLWRPFARAGEPVAQLPAMAELIRQHRALAVGAVAAAIAQSMDAHIDRAVMTAGPAARDSA